MSTKADLSSSQLVIMELSFSLCSNDLPLSCIRIKKAPTCVEALWPGIVGFTSLRRPPLMASLSKAFQRTASRFVGFFYAHPIKQACFAASHKKSSDLRRSFVNWLGLEPRAHTLKVYCSTN